MEDENTTSSDNSSSTDESTLGCSPFGDLNRSGVSDPQQWTIQSDFEHARFFIAAIQIVLCLLAIAWNVFILLTMLAKRRMLREPTNIYLFNLAAADLLLAVAVIPFTIVAQLVNEFDFGSSDYSRCIVCNFAGVTLQVTSAVSLHLLAALSFDRFFILAYPLRYKRWMTWKTALIASLGIWFISVWIGIPPVLGFGQYTFNRAFANCHPVWEGSDFNYVRFVLFESFIPIAILVVANIWSYRLVSVFLRRRFRRRTIIRREEGPDQLNEERNAHRKKQKKVSQMFTALLIVYLVTWTPNIIAAVIANFIPMPGTLEVAVFGWVCYITNPVLHPIIETCFIKELRDEVIRAKRWITLAGRKVFCGCACCCCMYCSGKTAEKRSQSIRVETEKRCSCIDGEESDRESSMNSPTADLTKNSDKVFGESYKEQGSVWEHVNIDNKAVISATNNGSLCELHSTTVSSV